MHSRSRSLESDCLKILVGFPLFENPTVPFLLGAMNVAGHVECSFGGMRELLEAMRDRIQSADNLVIEKCSTIGQIVVKAQPHLTAEIRFESRADHRRRLFCERIAGHSIRCNDLESLAHALSTFTAQILPLDTSRTILTLAGGPTLTRKSWQ